MKKNLSYLIVILCVFVWFQVGCDSTSDSKEKGIISGKKSPEVVEKSVKPYPKTIETTEKIEKVTSQKIADNSTEKLPKLVDLGRGTCIPCKMMFPVLEKLEKDYVGKVEVVFIDVGKKPEEAEKYGIKVIPTQILYNSSGKEVFRHEGYIPSEELEKEFRKIGVK